MRSLQLKFIHLMFTSFSEWFSIRTILDSLEKFAALHTEIERKKKPEHMHE